MDIFRAIETDDIDAVTRIVSLDPEQVRVRNLNGNQPLHEAVRFWRPRIVSFLLASGADRDAEGEDDNTPLHYAVGQDGDPALVKLLLASGADVEVYNSAGETPLFRAAVANPRIARLLLRHGAKLDLNSGVLLRRIGDVKQMLKDDPLLSRALYRGALLFDAVLVRSKKLVHLLLQHGLKPDSLSVFLAFQNALNDDSRDLDIPRMLLEAGAEPSIRNSYRESLPEFARKWENERSRGTLELLKEYGFE